MVLDLFGDVVVEFDPDLLSFVGLLVFVQVC